ncbi:BA71V-D129L [African swine fever virus]|uniref:BA71V-D129L n=1 Tax=African swine fever virus TaxID=10497 RepID=A0A0C5B285_ASF|nr:BA71V-D129L [African swine fever virus]AJL34116.1 BA71V-D129L [African swine fever virus]
MDLNPLLYLQAFNNDAITFNTQGHILEQQSDPTYFDTFASAMQAYIDTKQGGNDEEGTIIIMDDEDFNDSESLEDFLQMMNDEELNDRFSSDDEPEERVNPHEVNFYEVNPHEVNLMEINLHRDNQYESSKAPQATFDITEFIKTEEDDD